MHARKEERVQLSGSFSSRRGDAEVARVVHELNSANSTIQ